MIMVGRHSGPEEPAADCATVMYGVRSPSEMDWAYAPHVGNAVVLAFADAHTEMRPLKA